MPVRTRRQQQPAADDNGITATPLSRKSAQPSRPPPLWTQLTELLASLLFDRTYITSLANVMLYVEAVICLAIITFVKYTEIDWSTYMQQVDCFLNGTTDYNHIGGDTGPIVLGGRPVSFFLRSILHWYPAGHLYVYTGLRTLTAGGSEVRRAQYLFLLLYLANTAVLWRIYARLTSVPPYALLLSALSAYRLHSIFVLRLFNDPIAMLLFYAAVLAMLHDRHSLGAVLYSLAVSIKMNVLLTAPAVACIWLLCTGWQATLGHIAVCAAVQLLLGAPFLLSHPWSYLVSSFNLGRVFMFKWTVNWRFVPEPVFVHPLFHAVLLVGHVAVLLAFGSFCWFRFRGGLWPALRSRVRRRLTADECVYALFTCNFIGVMFSRSLHYQFYSWYHGQLPALLWSTSLPVPARVVLMLVTEYCWNVYPSTVLSSGLLNAVHFLIFIGLVHQNRKPNIAY